MIRANGGGIPSCKHVNLNPFCREIARQACGTQDTNASSRWKRVNDEQDLQGSHGAFSLVVLGLRTVDSVRPTLKSIPLVLLRDVLTCSHGKSHDR